MWVVCSIRNHGLPSAIPGGILVVVFLWVVCSIRNHGLPSAIPGGILVVVCSIRDHEHAGADVI